MDSLAQGLPLPIALLVAALLIALIAVLVVIVVKRRRQTDMPHFPPQAEVEPPPKLGEAAELEEPASPRAPPPPEKALDEAPAEESVEELEQIQVAVPTEEAPPAGVEEPLELPAAEEEEVEETVEETTETEEVPEEIPEAAGTRFQRLRARLARSGSLGQALLSVLSKGDLDEGDWEELEDTLLLADIGLPAVEELMDKLRVEMQVAGSASGEKAKEILSKQLLELVGPDWDRSLNVDPQEVDGSPFPATVLVVGVNGTGKTTSVGKLARLLRGEDKTVLLGAADTFRAAAAEQLTTWGDRVGVDVIRSEKEGGDPAAVAFEAVVEGQDRGTDVVLVDTAGRLQTKSALMDELGKIKRVMEKHGPVAEVLLVLDATTGQNGMRQAEVFAEAVGITGIVLTKLDGSAKGGIVISVQRELGVPVKLVGLGEGPDDLAPFDPQGFVDAILGD